MSTSTDFKTLEIPVDGVNSYIPPIIINEADNDGRNLKFIPLQDGQPVTGFTSARLYYDPRPKDAYSVGGYIDGTQDGDGWTFVIPANTFTADMQGNGSVSFTDSDGETYTRNIQFLVESGGTKALSQGSKIDQLVALLQSMVNDFTMTAEAETGAAGSQANVTVTRLPSGAYNLNFTIPTGPQGPKGDPGDLTTVAHDTTLTGDGTSGNPLGVNKYTVLDDNVDFNNVRTFGIYAKAWGRNVTNAPFSGNSNQYFLLVNSGGHATSDATQVIVPFGGVNGDDEIYFRYYSKNNNWCDWKRLITSIDLANYVPLSTYQSLETKVQALSTATSISPILSGTDLRTLFTKTGTYLKNWGTTVSGGPTSLHNSATSKYIVKVYSDLSDSYIRIDPISAVGDIYYAMLNSGELTSWYKVSAVKQ